MKVYRNLNKIYFNVLGDGQKYFVPATKNPRLTRPIFFTILTTNITESAVSLIKNIVF